MLRTLELGKEYSSKSVYTINNFTYRVEAVEGSRYSIRITNGEYIEYKENIKKSGDSMNLYEGCRIIEDSCPISETIYSIY